MITITGQYNTAHVYADELDQHSQAQIERLCNQAFTQGSVIRMMPDVHAGMGCTIGTTMTLTDRVVPNMVGVDIGCGMETVRLREKRCELSKLDKVIRANIPSGFEIRKSLHRMADEADLMRLRCAKHVKTDRGFHSVGTLGGGNHFIEMDTDDDGALYLVVHSGSRHIGLEVANHYQALAYQQCSGNAPCDIDALIARYKAEDRSAEIGAAIAALRTEQSSIPKDLAYVTGALFDDYLHDMRVIQSYAALNRRAMVDEIIRGMGLHAEDCFSTVHNYIDTDMMILRKGAVSARDGERLLIPINMRDGSLICIGRGNDEWNQSAPHGAGRLMSRTEARNRFTLNEYKAQMKGVYSTSVNRETLDECPMAYKSMESITSCLGETAAIERVIRPIFNFKAGEED